MEPDDTYWRLVEPIWKKVSIYDGGDVFLRGYAGISEKQKVLLPAHWAESEICNGGLHQFFWNPTGVLAPEAVQGFRALGMVRIASVIEEAMMFFESPYPRDRNRRIEVLEGNEDKDDPEWDPFGSLDDRGSLNDRFLDLIREEAGGFDSAADAFAAEEYG